MEGNRKWSEISQRTSNNAAQLVVLVVVCSTWACFRRKCVEKLLLKY